LTVCRADGRSSPGRFTWEMNMTTVPTAAVLLIGDEILSGRTKDKNLGFIADYLTSLGIDLKEARIVPDMEEEIVVAVRALSAASIVSPESASASSAAAITS